MIERIAAVSGLDVSRETFEKLEAYLKLLLEENERQNLISASSVEDVWERHFVDAAQLVSLAKTPGGTWCDIGSGAGLPGIVTAILTGQEHVLVEPRRLRAEFLQRTTDSLGLANVVVIAARAERVEGKFVHLTARAVARLDNLLAMTRHLAHDGTRFILPKGRTAKSELDEARRNWQGSFQLVPSQTNPDAAIIIADRVRPREKR